MPNMLHPDTWRKQQISRFSAGDTVFMGLAYRTLPSSRSPWVQFVDLAAQSG